MLPCIQYKDWNNNYSKIIITEGEEHNQPKNSYKPENTNFAPSIPAFFQKETFLIDDYRGSDNSSPNCSNITQDFFWAWSEIMYHYLWWKYEFTIYGIFVAEGKEYKEILDETETVIEKIELDIKKNPRLWYVYYRLLIIRARVRYESNNDDNCVSGFFKESEKDFEEAIMQLNEVGRIEYLPFPYHGYAKLLLRRWKMMCDNESKKSGRDSLKERAQCCLKTAIYLYKNLGDKEHEDVCRCEECELK